MVESRPAPEPWGLPASSEMGSWAPPAPSGPPDPGTATGPPWPRLVAAPGRGYRPPRLLRWPIVVGAILFVALIGQNVARLASGSSPGHSASPYALTADDAGFTATFPGKPERIEKTVGSTSVLLYITSLANEAVGVAYLPVASASTVNLDAAITGFATSEKNGKVLSRTSVTYQGQPAEDAVISFTGGVGNVRAVVIGSAIYLFEGLGPSASNFTSDYRVLLQTFTPSSPPTPATTSPPTSTQAPGPTTVAPTGTGNLGSEIVRAPAGFSLFQATGVQNGPMTAADFDSFVNTQGAAEELHFVTGYAINYDSPASTDLINMVLLQFASTSDAANFVGGFTVQGVKTGRDAAIPGAQVYDSTAASDGSYQHGVIASKGKVVLLVDYADSSPSRPALVDTLAEQQYARMG